ncbi:MAG: acetyl-CoA acetyltransferase [Gammaproteobacteria bacterium]
MRDLTPILVGAGQCMQRDFSDPARLLSPLGLMSLAAQRACIDAGLKPTALESIDALACVRLFEHSVGDRGMWPNPFGSTDNVPWAIARRLGLAPREAIYAEVGGQSPQRLVNRFAERVHAGDVRMALLTGAEAIATIRHGMRQKLAFDWREVAHGEFEDRWPGAPFVTPYEQRHGIAWPIHVYAMFEQVRRHARGMTLDACRAEIGRLFAPFSAVAAAHPYAQFPTALAHAFLATVSASNYALADPYTRWMVAQDGVNQGAAVLVTSVATARELGIPESRWVYLRGYADVDDVNVLKRPNLAASRAQNLAVTHALDTSGVGIDAVRHLDFYSCFPIAVSSIAEPLGLPLDGTRPLTLTGGLPFFGGPGNNYSMHAIATLVERLRADRDSLGLIVANGGYLSKHSAAVYAGRPAPVWAPVSSAAQQAEAKADTGIVVDEQGSGPATIETYAAIHAKGALTDGFVVARLASGARCLARVPPGDAAALGCLGQAAVIGRPILVGRDGELHTFRAA